MGYGADQTVSDGGGFHPPSSIATCHTTFSAGCSIPIPSSQCGLRFSTLAKSRCNKVSRRSPLFQVTEEIILRELADGGECGLGVDLGSGEIGGGFSEIRAAKRGLLPGAVQPAWAEVSGVLLRLVRGIAIEDALRR